MRRVLRSYFCCDVILIVCVLLQVAIVRNIQILPNTPDFTLICVLYFSVRNGRVHGEVNGFVSGLLLDFLASTPFGLNCMIRTLIGYIGGLFHVSANYESVLVNCFMGFAATLAKAVLLFVSLLLYPNSNGVDRIFSSLFAFELLANTLLTPLIFGLLRKFDAFIVLPTRQAPKLSTRSE